MYDGTPCIVIAERVRNRDGYGLCNVRRFGVTVNSRHRLAWIDANDCLPPAGRPSILHHCDNPPCENPKHLYAGTQQDNVRDTVKRQRQTRGVKQHSARLNDDLVRAIRDEAARGITNKELAKRYGCSAQNISYVVSRRTWKHVL